MKHSVNGAEIGYDDQGSGPVLLLIHAGIADRGMWDGQFAEFSGTHRVIRLDLRGFGESSQPGTPFANHDDVRALLDALDVERASIVGISMGGDVALDVTLAYPDRVSALVLVSTLAAMTSPSEALQRAWRESEEAFERGDIDGATAVEVAVWIVGRGRTADEVGPVYLANAEGMIRRIWERAATGEEPGEERELARPRTERLAEVRAPTLLVFGDRDLPDVPMSMDALAAGIPGARTVVIPNAAHLPPLEHPEQFNQILREFLANI